MQLKHIKSPFGLRKKLSALKTRGWSSTVIRFLKPLYWRDPSSSFSYRSSDSLETQDYVRPVQTSAEMSRPTSQPTPLSAKSLGLKSDKELNKLRRATVAWVLQSLKGESTEKHLSQNFWMASSDSLYTRGKAEGLLSTRASRMPAFFETNNVNLPQYA